MNPFLVNHGHKFLIGFLTLDKLWERGVKFYEKIHTTEQFLEGKIHDRRNHMGLISEAELLMGLIPKVEKIVADAKAADQSPAGQQLIIDIEALVNEVKTALASNAPPTPAAPPAGQV